MAFLTFGIPTYNRCEGVLARVEELFAAPLHKRDVDILIIDNASEDGTYEELNKLVDKKNPKIKTKILRNDTNIGFSRNFLKLIRESGSKYICTMTDEDGLIIDEFLSFYDFILEKKAVLISPTAMYDGKRYRGRRKNEIINPCDFRETSNFMPGVTYNLDFAHECLQTLSHFEHNCMVTLYPQVLTAILLLLKGEGYWYSNAVFENRMKFKTCISDTLDDKEIPYTNFISRSRQVHDLLIFLFAVRDKAKNEFESSRVEQMIQKAIEDIYYWVQLSVKHTFPKYFSSFENGALLRLKKTRPLEFNSAPVATQNTEDIQLLKNIVAELSMENARLRIK